MLSVDVPHSYLRYELQVLLRIEMVLLAQDQSDSALIDEVSRDRSLRDFCAASRFVGYLSIACCADPLLVGHAFHVCYGRMRIRRAGLWSIRNCAASLRDALLVSHAFHVCHVWENAVRIRRASAQEATNIVPNDCLRSLACHASSMLSF